MIGNNRLSDFLASKGREGRPGNGDEAEDFDRSTSGSAGPQLNHFVVHHPLEFLAAAFATGVVLAWFIKRR